MSPIDLSNGVQKVAYSDDSMFRAHQLRPVFLFSCGALLCFFLDNAGLAAGLSCPPPLQLKRLLQSEMDGSRNDANPILLPCCYDGLTARLVARAGFEATFMTGFGVSGKPLLTQSHISSLQRDHLNVTSRPLQL